MKKILSIAALSMLTLSSLLTAPAQAANTFNVGVTLTSKCEVVSVPTASFAYTSFQTGPTDVSSSFNVHCTNLLPISSILLDDGIGGVAAGLTQSYTDAQTNLTYSLTLSTVPTKGDGGNQPVTLTGTMLGGQAGTCATATCTNTTSNNKTRTLTVSY